jgi:hypothetical protein
MKKKRKNVCFANISRYFHLLSSGFVKKLRNLNTFMLTLCQTKEVAL